MIAKIKGSWDYRVLDGLGASSMDLGRPSLSLEREWTRGTRPHGWDSTVTIEGWTSTVDFGGLEWPS